MNAYVFPAIHQAKATLTIDAHSKTMPSKIWSGPHAGKLFLDAGLAQRDPRWIPLFEPLISDPANQVQLVNLTRKELTPPSMTP